MSENSSMANNEKIKINEIEATKLAEQYKTPIYLKNAEKMERNYKKLEKAFEKHIEDFEIH